MGLSIMASNQTMYMVGTPEPFEKFSTALIRGAAGGPWLTVEGDMITLRDSVGRVVVYRIVSSPQTDVTDDRTFVDTVLVSDSDDPGRGERGQHGS
jgi:hypothetical protein